MKPRFPSAISLRILAFGLVVASAPLNTAISAPGPADWGSALSLDGVDDFARSQQAVNLADRSFTVEAWAQRRSTDSMDMIVAQGNGAPGTGLMFGYHWSWVGFVFDFYGDGVVSLDGYDDTGWHHWAGSYDASTGAIADTGVELQHPELASRTAAAPHYNFAHSSTNVGPLNDYYDGAHAPRSPGWRRPRSTMLA